MFTARLSVLFVFLFTSFVATAQISGHFAVKAGANLSLTAQEGVTSFESKLRNDLHLGGLYRLRINSFVLQPELMYSNKGGRFRGTQGTRETIRNSYRYISAPIMLGWIPTEGLTLQAGPEFSYALNTPTSNGPGVRNDLGIAVGVHYDFLDAVDKFSLNLRYIYGLKDISINPIVERYNRTFQASIVYNFYKKKKK
ncbi:porin family protein [Tellurirhabdus bombi]|uniref:porin family protein n=1 Tax=Tellurirhabdus bombi TaxID=2907205 RepID=UPI001F343199|nr:porin family protein [Tellurirhabdus bombi]